MTSDDPEPGWLAGRLKSRKKPSLTNLPMLIVNEFSVHVQLWKQLSLLGLS